MVVIYFVLRVIIMESFFKNSLCLCNERTNAFKKKKKSILLRDVIVESFFENNLGLSNERTSDCNFKKKKLFRDVIMQSFFKNSLSLSKERMISLLLGCCCFFVVCVCAVSYTHLTLPTRSTV